MADLEQKLGDYLIIERLAQGGMAQVYKAKTVDPNGIDRLVVIKRILPHISSNPEYIEMLIDEAKIAVHFTHGNIAQVYDLGKVGEDYFIVMEYVDGKTLGQILRNFRQREIPIPLDVILFCLAELCQGLDYIHNKADPQGKPMGVVHRDVSPQNIIVSYSGTVKIIDFGVAKAEEKISQTESGVLKGKFAYMSPEQADGNPVDRRSDIFSAGILLWELLTQERLFKRKSNMQTIKAVRKGKYKPASKKRGDVPKELDQVIAKALQRKPARRYQNAFEMGNDLKRILLQEFPDFKPIQVAEFLYRYFGPEADEEDLPPELPQLDIKKEEIPSEKKKVKEKLEEEQTEVDRLANFVSFLNPRPLIDKLKERLKQFEWKKNKAWLYGGGGVFLALLIGLGSWGLYNTAQGTLIVEVKPEDALVTIDGRPLEQTGQVYLVKKPSDEEIRLKVTKKGFLPHESTLFLKRKEVKKVAVVLKKDIPPFGDVEIHSDPPGATIYIDDIEWNKKTPTTVPRLKSGKNYRLGLYLDKYKFLEKEIVLKPGELKTVRLTLKIDYASLEISSSPMGANVIIDNQIVGTTPYKNLKVSPRSAFDLSLELEGFQSIKKVIVLEPGEKMKLNFDLRKQIANDEKQP